MWQCRRERKWIMSHLSGKLQRKLFLKETDGNLVNLLCLFSVFCLAGTTSKFRIRVWNLDLWMQQMLQKLGTLNLCSRTLENTIRHTPYFNSQRIWHCIRDETQVTESWLTAWLSTTPWRSMRERKYTSTLWPPYWMEVTDQLCARAPSSKGTPRPPPDILCQESWQTQWDDLDAVKKNCIMNPWFKIYRTYVSLLVNTAWRVLGLRMEGTASNTRG
jgi:hypothetical protein